MLQLLLERQKLIEDIFGIAILLFSPSDTSCQYFLLSAESWRKYYQT